MKSASRKLFSITLCIVLASVLVPGVFAEESPDVITQESRYFSVGYSLAEGYGTSHWTLLNSEDISKSADVTGNNALALERFRYAVDTCIIYEEQISRGFYTLFFSGFSPAIWAVTLPEIIESWEQAEFAAKKADYFFSQIS